MKKVYVAGPYTKGDVAVNVKNAIDAGSQLADAGFAPMIPHLSHFWHLVSPRPYDYWIALDLEFLPFCDYLLRIPGESSGADNEVAVAESLGIPVFFSVESLLGQARS